jgi:hypothetical protein
MANLADICVMLNVLSSSLQPYACGKTFRKPLSRPNYPISGPTRTIVIGFKIIVLDCVIGRRGIPITASSLIPILGDNEIALFHAGCCPHHSDHYRDNKLTLTPIGWMTIA